MANSLRLAATSLMKFGGNPGDFSLGEDRVERLHLLLGGKDRTFDETLRNPRFAQSIRKGGEIGGSLGRSSRFPG